MKSTSISILMTSFVIVMAMCFGSARLSADVIPSTYDGLDYTAGDSINGQSGGSGWDNNWGANDDNNATVVSPGLTYSQNGTLDTVGNAVELDGDNSSKSTVAAYRSPTDDFASDSYWASALVQLSSSSSNNGATLLVGDTDIYMAPQGDGTYNADLKAPDVGTADEDFVTDLPQDEALFLVLQLDRTAGDNGVVNAWVNPDVSGTSPTNALGSGSISLDSDASEIGNIVVNAQGTHTWDEMRLGDSFESVAIPEPSTMVLLGLSVLLLMKRRRL